MYYNDENQILFIERVSYFFLKKYEKKSKYIALCSNFKNFLS